MKNIREHRRNETNAQTIVNLKQLQSEMKESPISGTLKVVYCLKLILMASLSQTGLHKKIKKGSDFVFF